MLSVRNITIKYGESAVLRDVSFELADGRIVAVLGANGAGKTTLLRALNGALPVAAGEILLDGAPLKNYSRRGIARRISVVAQETETAGRFAHGGVFGWETGHDAAASRLALEMCDLKDFDSRLMNELSGGERQRVVFARAVATEAAVLLLDEPTANLDLAHQAMMFRLVRERCRSCRGAAVVITHDLNLAAEFADQLLLLQNGQIFAKGTPEDVLTGENIRAVFGVRVLLDRNPASGKTRVTTIF
jgi:iron complex transport system ATP-binding protein